MLVVAVALATIGGLSTVLASLLVAAKRRLHVEEDPRIDVVEDMLPLANCGACGVPGCRQFAEALVKGESSPGKCTVSSEDGRIRIATFLGVDVGAEEKQVARLACGGGENVARKRAEYVGVTSCAGAAQVAGGGKACFWGCLGLGDCDVACDFHAISMNNQGLPEVDEDLCTACGDCVTACPKDLFSIQPIGRRLWVNCRSQEAGDEVLDECDVACTACARCAMDGPGLVTMRDNLPVVDYAAAHGTDKPIQRCPTGAIVWLEPGGGLRKGKEAKKIIRQEPRRAAPT